MHLLSRPFLALLILLVAADVRAIDALDRSSAVTMCENEISRLEALVPTHTCGDFVNYAPCTCVVGTPQPDDNTCMAEIRSKNGQGAGLASEFLCPSDHEPTKTLGQPAQCPVGENEDTCGNPITISIGNKFQVEPDFDGPGLLDFVRYYNSHPDAPNESLGPRWSHTYSTRVDLPLSSIVATVHLSHGRQIAFTFGSGTWNAGPESAARLIEVLNGSGVRTGWRYIERDEREVDEFDAVGRLVAIKRTDGNALALVYNNGVNGTAEENLLVTSVTDERGRSLQLDYDSNHRLIEMIDAGGTTHKYTYDASGRLEKAGIMVGVVHKFRTYQYNESSLTSGANIPFALTGIIDENGDPFADFGYAANGMATLTQHAGGAERFEVTNNLNDGSSTVVTPFGVSQARETTIINGVRLVSEVTETCTDCDPRTRAYTYDTRGRIDEFTDELEVVTDYDYDSRGLLTQVIEAESDTNGDKRTTQTDWDSTFNVPTERRIYDAANTLVGKWTWTYDTTGRGQVAIASRIDPTNSVARTTTFTYCEASDVVAPNSTCPILGLLKTLDGPGTNDMMTYAYRTSDSLTGCGTFTGNCHRKGDLNTVTNGFGQVVMMIQRYDAAGRVMQWRDANLVVTQLEYDEAGRLDVHRIMGPNNSITTDDATTTIAYDDVGQVTLITSPTGSTLAFAYDDAHRLVEITDGNGNKQEFEPSPAGGIESSALLDSNDVLRQSSTASFNEFGELESATDANSHDTVFAYDDGGYLVGVSDPLGRLTSHAYDALGRLRQTIADAGTNGIAATSEFTYDALDQLVAVEDPNHLVTGYEYDGFGNLAELTSPDTGTTTYGYDAAGNRTSSIDGDGRSATNAFDRLGRPTAVDYTGTDSDSSYTWDVAPSGVCQTEETFAVGRLGTMTDPSGSTGFCYDRRGNLVRKVQAVSHSAGTATSTVAYRFDFADQLTGMTYPSGATVTYSRDPGTGRITSIVGKPSGSGSDVALINAVSYLPFGPVSTITFETGTSDRTLTKDYDENYGIHEITGGTGFEIDYTLDFSGNVIGLTEETKFGPESRLIAYDGLDRVTSMHEGSTLEQGFTYDATGNRLSKTTSSGTANYSYATGTHHLVNDGVNARELDDAGHGTRLTGTKGFEYDDRGRMVRYYLTTGGVRNLTRTYIYNARDERVARWHNPTPANNMVFVYDEVGHLLGEYRTDGTRIREYVWMDDTPVAVFNGPVTGTSTQFILTDHLNTPRAVVNSSNTIVWRWDLTKTVFGEHAVDGNPDGDSDNYTLNLRYPGQYYDADTGLHQNYFRDYDPGTGRYFQSDPIGLLGGVSSYSYTLGSPFGSADPAGLAPIAIPWWLPKPIPAGPATPWLMGGLLTAAAVQHGWEHVSGDPLGVDIYDVFDNSPPFGTIGCEGGLGPLCTEALAQYADRLNQRELKPRNCPRGVRPINQAGLTTEEIHRIKRGINAGARDWVGIGGDGTIWTNEDGEAAPQGNTSDHDVKKD